MSKLYNEALRHYLFELISDNKRNLFTTVIKNRTRHLTIVLENIFQAHNASAVLRSCDISGIQDVHAIENKNKYTISQDVAMGSSKWLNIIKHNQQENNTIPCFETLRKQGYQIVATTPHEKGITIEELPLDKKIALVFGTELTGLSDEAMENADAYVRIPMYGFTESFNISVSAAISMFYLTQKLRNSDINWQLSENEITEIQIAWAKASIKKSKLIIDKFNSTYTE